MTLSCPETETLELYRGKAQTWSFTVNNNGSALNLTGSTIRFVVRDAEPDGSITADTDALLSITTASNITITDAAAGKFDVKVTKANTASWRIIHKTDYFYEISALLLGAADPITIGYGIFRIYPDRART